jgi:hypothetical protein
MDSEAQGVALRQHAAALSAAEEVDMVLPGKVHQVSVFISTMPKHL